jgi:Uma2 family endonuclease
VARLEEVQHRRFTVDEVERMVQLGILDEDEPVEILEGALVVMPPESPGHATNTERVRRAIEPHVGPGLHVRSNLPMKASPDSLPVPDVALYRGPFDAFENAHPSGCDALLVVEIALTSHAIDRKKASLYSRAGVPVYWLLDLSGRRLEVHSDPRPAGDYRLIRILDPSERVAVPGTNAEIEVGKLLP